MVRCVLPFISAICAGGLLPCAFAPFELWPCAILSPAWLLWLWQHASPKRALQLGMCFGIGFFGVGVSWVFVSIHRYGNTDVPLAIFLTGLFILVLSLFTATQGYTFQRFFAGKGERSSILLFFPVHWVFFEWLRSWFLSGFPWLFLGYTQLKTPLSGYAPLASVYGVSLIVAFTSVAFLTLLTGKKSAKKWSILMLILVWGMGWVLKTKTWTTPTTTVKTVSIIQGNIEPRDKFSTNHPLEATERIYGQFTQRAWGSDLILWPENAITLPLPYSKDFVTAWDALAKNHNATLIVGTQTLVSDDEYYNTLIALGQGSGHYQKRRLVIFGEFVPFDRYLRGLINFFDIPMSNFTPGPKDQPLITAGTLKVTPLVCYEVAFPELVRSSIKASNVIVNLSEDGWFGDSFGPHQHLEIARMRALESGRYVLRATTSGISAIIDAKGSLTSISPQFQRLILKGTFQGMEGSTPWMKVGLWPFWILVWITLGLAWQQHRAKA